MVSFSHDKQKRERDGLRNGRGRRGVGIQIGAKDVDGIVSIMIILIELCLISWYHHNGWEGDGEMCKHSESVRTRIVPWRKR